MLGRRIQRALLLLAVGFIVYGTTGPVADSTGTWLRSPEYWRWIPPLRGFDRNDLLTNILAYLPVGFSIRLICRRRGRRPIVDFTMAMTAATALSWITEVLQQYLPARASSLTDVFINVFGAAIGAMLAPPIQRWLRELQAKAYAAAQTDRARVLSWYVFAALAAAMTAPWRPSGLSVDLTWKAGGLATDVGNFVSFAIWAGFMAVSLLRGAGADGRTFLRLIGIAAIGAAAIEAAQSVLELHTASLRDFLIEAAGGAFGAAIVCRYVALSVRVRRMGKVTSIAALASLLVLAWPDLKAATFHEPAIQWVPFQAEFQAAFSVSAASMLSRLLFLGVICLVGHELAGSGGGWGVVALTTIGAVFVELARGTFSDHVITPTVFALLAIACFLSARVRSSLLPLPEASRRGDDRVVVGGQLAPAT
ncbi:MAG: VanZ family protein [Planctomycetes bacterium]|nr:VanZ family protein [Planctomycetota bacterium]